MGHAFGAISKILGFTPSDRQCLLFLFVKLRSWSSPIASWQTDGETVTGFIFGGSQITADGDAALELKDACSLEKSYDQPRQHIKKQRHYFTNKVPSSQNYGFSSSHVMDVRVGL